MGTVVATAALAVGTYHVAKWAWGVYEESTRKQQGQQQQQQQSVASMEVSNREEEEEEDLEKEALIEIVEEELVEGDDERGLDDRGGAATRSKRRDNNDLILEDDREESVASHGVRFLLPGKSDPKRNGNTSTKAKVGKTSSQAVEKPSASNPQVPPHLSSASPAHKLNASHMKIRRQRMARCRDEAATALSGFLSTVKRVVDERTDTLQELRELKKLRAERVRRSTGSDDRATTPSSQSLSQLSSLSEETTARREKELWERVKVRSVTKMLASAYAHTVLFLVLTVQVNLLGGRLFEEQIYRAHEDDHNDHGDSHGKESSTSAEAAAAAAERRMVSYQASHRFVLTHTYEHFFQRGLVQLIDSVEHAAATALSDWDVLDASSLQFTADQFDEGLRRVRDLVVEVPPTSSAADASGEARGLLRFVVPPTHDAAAATPSDLAGSDELARSILDETWDLLESPVLEDALVACLNTTFDVMRDEHWGTVFEDPSTSYTLSGTAGMGMGLGALRPAHVHVPLATVLTKLKNTTGSFYEGPRAAANANADGVEGATTSGPAAVLVGSGSYCSALERLSTVLELADVSFG
jgi:peroxin-3